MVLDEYFGGKKNIPAKMEAVVRQGEEKIDERLQMLKMMDKVSWLAVDEYVADPLCKDEEDDKRWKKAVREAKEDAQSRRRGGYSSYSRRGQGSRDGYRR